eukprot:1671918-Rhodomonas_salina.1
MVVSKTTAKLSVLEQVDLRIQRYLCSTGPRLVLTRSDTLFRWCRRRFIRYCPQLLCSLQ